MAPNQTQEFNLSEKTPPAVTDFAWGNYSRGYLVVTYAYLCPVLLPVSLVGNALILCAFGRRAFQIPTHHRYFYVCIALGDMIAVVGMHGLFIVAGDGLFWLSGHRLALYPDRISDNSCRFARIVWKAGETLSNYTMLLFCFERLLAITCPLRLRVLFSPRRAVLMQLSLVSTCFGYLAWMTVRTHSLVKSEESPTGMICMPDASKPITQTLLIVNLFVLHWGHLLPTLILNFWLWISLKRASACRARLVRAPMMRPRRDRPSQKEIASAVTILMASMCTVFTWAPHSVLSQLHHVLESRPDAKATLESRDLLAFVGNLNLASLFWIIFNHTLNFWIYFARMPRFRALLCPCCVAHRVTFVDSYRDRRTPNNLDASRQLSHNNHY